MFERYTEKARRVIFFARYEASQLGSSYIETEHLLLGLLREDKVLAHRFLKSHAAIESIRKQIETHTPVRESTSTSVDLPLSHESKRVLTYGAEEAERLEHKHIGTEHLLLGLMRQDKTLAAEILNEKGLQLSVMRDEIASSVVSTVAYTSDLETVRRSHIDEKPYYEYWDGQAIQKPAPSVLHSLLQVILINLLRETGLISAGEVRLQLNRTRQPIPDVIAGNRLQHPYPTKPFAVAIEILSPDDRMQRLLRRCRFLSEQGIPYIYVFDPEDRTAQRWSHEKEMLENVEWLESGDWPSIPVGRIWNALDQELDRVDFSD